MNAFEDLVASLLRRRGYWTQVGYKVELSKATKRSLGKPSLPRPEIDIVAYKPAKNELLWVECKTHMHSRGVHRGMVTPGPAQIVVFADSRYRNIVTRRLLSQMKHQELVREQPTVKYCLAAAHIATPFQRDKLHELFVKKHWELWDEDWIGREVMKLGDLGYEDEIAVVVAQLWKQTQLFIAAGLQDGDAKRGQT